MKISEALPTYYQNRKVLVDQTRFLFNEKTKAEKEYRLTGDKALAEKAAKLDISLEATEKAFQENQEVIDGMMEQWVAVCNMESSKQQGDAMAEYAKDMGKIMTVFRRLAHGDIVPLSDERKLMEYSDKLYKAAKNMQAMAQQLEERERKRHKSLWEDDEPKEYPDPEEVADNAEYAGELPEIEIPETGIDEYA